MKKGFKMIILLIIAIIVIAIIVLFCIQKHRMTSLLKMTSKECIDYCTKNKDDVFITVGIIKDGKQSWKIYGRNGKKLPQTEYLYEIGSITKTFTCGLLCKALNENRISLDDQISKYLDFSKETDIPSYTPTILRLATHTSGFGNYLHSPLIKNQLSGKNPFYNCNKEKLTEKILSKKLKDKTYDWAYSNFGMSCVGEVLGSVYKEFGGFKNAMENFIQQDLNLHHTYVNFTTANSKETKQPNSFKYWEWKDDDSYLAAGSIVSNITDMLTYAQIHLDIEVAKLTGKPISNSPAQGLEYLATGHKLYEDTKPMNQLEVNVEGMGLAWVFDKQNDVLWHNGGTTDFNSYLGLDAKHNTAVVAFMNKGPGFRIPATMFGAKIIKELRAAKN